MPRRRIAALAGLDDATLLGGSWKFPSPAQTGAQLTAAMNRPTDMTDKPDPWRVPVAVAQIPETGLHRDIEADPAAREAIAEVGGLREILVGAVRRSTSRPMSGGRFHVEGRVRARIGQTCVVTLDPIENEIDEPIDLIFAPPEQIPEMAALVDEAAESDVEIPDPPEPIENGVIDLGRLATDALYLAVDPYPRKPDAVFEPPGGAPRIPRIIRLPRSRRCSSTPNRPAPKKPKGKR